MTGSYLVLARKYRPKTFDEVVGQDVAKRVLRGAIAEGRVGHAYLLAGPRGTGKTTLARIVARSLNCEQGPTPDPCGVCERCTGLDAGREADVVEIDAASHTGVDSIRDLRDEVAYSPLRARRKIYIIDEVHMLSKAAFNALLKTLEEPPPHVVFLFATTEPHKVLETILSRCQVLRLEALPVDDIAARLDVVFAAEGIEAEAGITEEIARGARGGMRDALSKADELLALGGRTPTLADLARLGAGGSSASVGALLDAIEAGDKPGLLELLAQVPGTPAERLGRLLAELRRSVLVGHLGVGSPQVEGSPEEREEAMTRAKRLGLRRLELMMQELLRARERARLLPGEEHVVLEVALLELADPDATIPLAELAARLEALAGGEPLAPREVARPRPKAPAPTPAPAPRELDEAPRASVAPRSTASKAPSKPARAPAPSARAEGSPLDWLKAAAAVLIGSHPTLGELLERSGRLDVRGANGELVLSGLDTTHTRLASDKRNQRRLADALVKASGLEAVAVRIVEGVAAPPPGATTRAAPVDSERPVTKRAEPEQVSSSAPAPPAARPADGLTSEVAGLFDGKVEDI